MSEVELPKELMIRCTRIDRVGLDKFWSDVQEAMNNGYEYRTNHHIKTCPHFAPAPRVTLYLKEQKEIQNLTDSLPTVSDIPFGDLEIEIELKEVQLEDALSTDEESIRTKAKSPIKNETPLEGELKTCRNLAEVIDFAKRYGIELPDERRPPVLKKYIKEVITSDDFTNNLD